MSLSNIKVNNTTVISVDDEPVINSKNLVESGGVAEKIKSVDDILEIIAPTTKIEFDGTNQCIETLSNTLDYTHPIAQSYVSYAVRLCSPGDKFTILAAGGNAFKCCSFIDNSGKVLKQYYSIEKPTIVEAPTNSTRVVFNVTTINPYFLHEGCIPSLLVDNIISDINNSAITHSIQLNKGLVVNTSPSVIDISDFIMGANTVNAGYAILNCSKGDKFIVEGHGITNADVYCFIDNAGNKLLSERTVDDTKIIIAPKNTNKVIFNASLLNSYTFYKIGLEAEVDESIIYLNSNCYIKTSSSTVDITPIKYNGYNSIALKCIEGDTFTIMGTGVGLCSLYCFIDSSGNKLELKQTTTNPIIITAPHNTDRVVFNADSTKPYYFYYGQVPLISLSQTNDDLYKITNNKRIVLKNGWRIITTGTVSTTPEYYNGFACTALDCSEGDKFTVWGRGGSSAYLYCFIDNNGNMLSSEQTVNSPKIIEAPHNASKVIFNVVNLDDEDYGIYSGALNYLSIEQLESVSINTWFNKTVFTFGDSITWYDGNEFGESHSEAGQVAVGYQSYLRQLGCTVMNYGADGNRMPGILNVIKSKTYTDCDCVTITCGANDFRATTIEQLGQIEPIGSTFDETTMIGALQAAIEWLSSTKQSLKIFLITPIKGFTYSSGGIWGTMPEEYPQAIIDVGKLYSLPVCDWYNNSGINFLNKGWFIGDDETVTHYKLHPTNAGYRLMGEMLRGFFSIR